MNYLFASDLDLNIIKQFDVKHWMLRMASPTTILVDSNKVIKMIFGGVRTPGKRKKMHDTICEAGQNCATRPGKS